MRKIRAACENAKRQLSFSSTATINATIGDDEINMELTRAKFEKLCESLCQKCLESVKSVLNDSKVAKDGVDEVVLVGGSTRIPRVQTILMVRDRPSFPRPPLPHPMWALIYLVAHTLSCATVF